MAPENVCKPMIFNTSADVYAFGIIVWEILTRLEPYEDKEPMQIVVEVVNDVTDDSLLRQPTNSHVRTSDPPFHPST